jgi:hypothetical protein
MAHSRRAANYQWATTSRGNADWRARRKLEQRSSLGSVRFCPGPSRRDAQLSRCRACCRNARVDALALRTVPSQNGEVVEKPSGEGSLAIVVD